MKLWNGTHITHIYFKRTNSEVKLGTLYVNKMKNVEDRYKVLENMNVMENFIVGGENHNVIDHLLNLIVDDKRLFVAVDQGSSKMRDRLLVIVAPKSKVMARKWMSPVCGREAIEKEKLDYLTKPLHRTIFLQK